MRKKVKEIIKSYKIYHELTDKKLLNTITKEEEIELEKVRKEIEEYDDDSELTRFLQDRIKKYQEILKELKNIKQKINDKSNEVK